ncbi:hypothetical protein Tco_0628146 [Tanacetum coccineum]|uniref:Transposase, Ptta/En/Spm, transposase, Tnp1/En/Spm-like protein n=1 Tax=Tanacetum coccineum TaxID=301880 RepID=A0ABQ4WPH4_9ASTR
MEKDSEIYKGKKERIKSIALKAKKESSDDETSTSESDDEEYAMTVRNFKKFFRRKGKFVRQPKEEKKSFRQRDEGKGKTISQQRSKGLHWSDNASSLDNDTMQIEYDSLCEISLKIINKNKTLKTKRDLLEKEVLELNEKIKKLERSKEIDIACKLCQELKLENARLKETQAKFVKFDKSANSLREMLDNQKSSSCKVGLGFDSNKASTSETKPIIFIGSSAEKATNGSTIKVHGSTLPGSSCRSVRSFFLDVVKSLSLEYEHVDMNLTLLERGRFIIRTSLTGFPAQSVRSSNADALDSLYLLVLYIGTPQSRLPH